MILRAERYDGRHLGQFPEIRDVFRSVAQGEALLTDFFATIDELKKDALRAITYSNKGSHADFWKRTIIKTMFAWFEGQTIAMKRIAHARDEVFEIPFTAPELAILRVDKYTLKENGEVTAKPINHEPLIPNVQFAFKCLAKAHGKFFQLDSKGLPELSKAEKIRNRLTHPKSADDLTVSDDELKLAQTVIQWFADQTAKLFGLCSHPSTLPLRSNSVRGQIELTMPWLVYWPDANAYEFPTRRAAKEFVKACGAASDEDFLLFGPYPKSQLANS